MERIMKEPVTVTLNSRRDAHRYRVEYDDAGQPRSVAVCAATTNYGWRAIWNSDYPLEGGSKEHRAIRAAERQTAQ
jgi:hypothetical protein